MGRTIGLFLRTLDNDYQQRLREVALLEAKACGFEILVESAQFDVNRQVAQIRTAIANAATSKLAAVLVSCVKDEALPPLAHEAAQAGLDWALLNEGAFIDDVRGQHPSRAIFAVTPDQAEIGRIHGQQVKVLLGSAGRVLCVTGPLHNISAQRRLDGLIEALDGKFELVELNADWTSEGARMAVQRWAAGISSQEELPAMFVAHNDEMALGVRQALRDVDSRRGFAVATAPILGCDGSQTFGQRLVRERRLKATVIMPPASGVAIQRLARVYATGELPPARVFLPVTSFPPLPDLS
jgi:ABC-type sugar transport system substrate-binding protein